MLFNSQIFILVFLPITIFTYYLLPSQILRIRCLIISSFVFYAYWDIRFLPLLILSICSNWTISIVFCALKKNWIIYIGIALNLLSIGVFKYYGFFTDILLEFTQIKISHSEIILPLGISFFTFQQISYLVDLKRNQAGKYKFEEFALFITFFPQLIAGPIVRHNEIINQFSKNPFSQDMHEKISRGIILFTLGLGKKVFLADEFGIINDEGFQSMFHGGELSTASAWYFALSYTLQLYFDFSAYSDMAIGLGAIFGFQLPMNFNSPYKSSNLQEFWRRWHLTLSRFFRDYLYIPLGGSKNGYIKYVIAALITMTLCGLWHGAGWSFVLWGFLHGCGLIIYHLWQKTGFKLPTLVAWLITFIFVVCGWVLFKVEDLNIAFDILNKMFVINTLPILRLYDQNLMILIIALIISIFGPTNYQLAYEKAKNNNLTLYPISFLLFVSILWVGGEREIEFIYFQF